MERAFLGRFMQDKELIKCAKEVRGNAYAPFSNFKVGAAILTLEGEVYTGCNVENSSYALTICAERVALVKALRRGKRFHKNPLKQIHYPA